MTKPSLPAVCHALEARRLMAGVTLITHGFNSDADGWVMTMADAVAWRQGVTAAQQPRYKLFADDGGTSNSPITVTATQLGPAVASWGSADVVLLLDWSELAGTLPFGGYNRPTGVVGSAVAAALAQPGFIAGLSGSLAEMPIHLIGHSRGAALVTAAARELSAAGLWVDQVTTLDPHPVDGINEPFGLPLDFGDGPVPAYENVVFHDNYWRTDGPFSTDVTGQPVVGAFDLQLSESVLGTGGYPNGEHSDVHLWYFGTIDTRPNAHNGDHPVPGNWYNGNMGPRDALGFAFTPLGAVARPAVGIAPNFGGGGSRVAVPAAGAQWPNIGELMVTTPSSAVIAGQPFDVQYLQQDRDGGAGVAFWLDDDANPFDGEPRELRGGASHGASALPTTATATVGTVGLEAGDYFVWAEIADAGGRRRLVARAVTLLPAGPTVTSSAFDVDRPAQTVTLAFDQDVGATLTADDIEVTNLTTGQVVPTTSIALVYNPSTGVAAFTFPGFPAGVLPDGNYRLVLPAGSVSGDGPPLAEDFTIDYFFLQGDATRDRAVNLADFGVLRSSFGLTDRLFTQGDFNYDGTVNLTDFGILRGRFGLTLPPLGGDLFGGDDQE